MKHFDNFTFSKEVTKSYFILVQIFGISFTFFIILLTPSHKKGTVLYLNCQNVDEPR